MTSHNKIPVYVVYLREITVTQANAPAISALYSSFDK